jgi:small subunit ribosomal protein S18
MPREQRERSERSEKFQTFSRPRIAKVTRTSASGTTYVDYKDTETLKKVVSANGKILTRRRTGVSAMEQRMIARAVKRARYMALLPYISTSV